MPYFHASRIVYPVGHLIRVPEGETSRAYQRSLDLGNQWREDALEAARAGRASSRQTAVYAANTVANAAMFLAAQPNPENLPVRAYEVTVSTESPSPMILIGYMDNQGPGFADLAECLEEYWAPKESWSFLEHVCAEMTIVADLGEVTQMDMYPADVTYEHDRLLARQLWGPLPPQAPIVHG